MTASQGIRATAVHTCYGPAQGPPALLHPDHLPHPARARELGYFDVTRKGADTEFRLRLQKTFGSRRWIRLDAKHTVIRQSPTSLSGGEVGEGWMHPLRFAYEAGFHHWHRDIQAKRAKPFLPDATTQRPFPAPAPLLGAERITAVDRVYIGDWREAGPQQRAMLDELERDAAAGTAVAIAHYESWAAVADRYVPVGREAVRRAHLAGAEWVDLREIRAEGALAADELIAAAVAFDFPDARIGPVAVMPPVPEEPEPAVVPPSAVSRATGRARSLAGRLKRLPRNSFAARRPCCGGAWAGPPGSCACCAPGSTRPSRTCSACPPRSSGGRWSCGPTASTSAGRSRPARTWAAWPARRPRSRRCGSRRWRP